MEEKIEKVNKGKTSSGIVPIVAIVLAFSALSGCMFPTKAEAASNSVEPSEIVQVTPKPEITETPSPVPTEITTPTPSPTQLPMDVDLGLTDSIRNKKRMFSGIKLMNVSIDSKKYWIIGRIGSVDNKKEVWGFKNLNDEKFIVYFDDIDMVLNYINNGGDIGEYKSNPDILALGEFKINEIISVYNYKHKYASNIKTNFDYMLINREILSKYEMDDVTYEQLDEFYRTVIPREQWFVPSERYVKAEENTPTVAPTSFRLTGQRDSNVYAGYRNQGYYKAPNHGRNI